MAKELHPWPEWGVECRISNLGGMSCWGWLDSEVPARFPTAVEDVGLYSNYG